MRGFSRGLFNGEALDVVEAHRAVACKSLVFRSNLAGSVLKLPWRVGKNRFELAVADKACQVEGGGNSRFVDCHSSPVMYDVESKPATHPSMRLGRDPWPLLVEWHRIRGTGSSYRNQRRVGVTVKPATTGCATACRILRTYP